MSHNSVSFSDPLTLTLDVVGPKPNPSRGEPVESVKVLFEDAQIEAGVWECTPGGWAIVDRPTTETMLLLAGQARITPADGEPVELEEGDVFVLPKGWSGRWDVLETVRKLYVLAVSYTHLTLPTN